MSSCGREAGEREATLKNRGCGVAGREATEVVAVKGKAASALSLTTKESACAGAASHAATSLAAPALLPSRLCTAIGHREAARVESQVGRPERGGGGPSGGTCCATGQRASPHLPPHRLAAANFAVLHLPYTPCGSSSPPEHAFSPSERRAQFQVQMASVAASIQRIAVSNTLCDPRASRLRPAGRPSPSNLLRPSRRASSRCVADSLAAGQHGEGARVV